MNYHIMETRANGLVSYNITLVHEDEPFASMDVLRNITELTRLLAGEKEIHWRAGPDVHVERDHDTDRTLIKGHVRFSLIEYAYKEIRSSLPGIGEEFVP